jgi:hypothetical protein
MLNLTVSAYFRFRRVLPVLFICCIALTACERNDDSAGVAENEASKEVKDHASAELRARIEDFKKAVAAEPTTPATLYERAQLFWEWLNIYALNGHPVPVETPVIAAASLAMDPELRGKERPPVFGFDLHHEIDRYVREFALIEAAPDAAGALSTSTPGPFISGSFVTLQQTWTVGSKPMLPGGGILVASHWFNRPVVPQGDDPAGDNYVSIKCSNPNAQFTPEYIEYGGQHGGFRSEAKALVFRLEGATLNRGENVTLTYGDRSGGSRGYKVQLPTTDRFPLPVYVDLGNGDFLTLPIQHIQVTGGPVAGVHGFAPSIVRLGSKAEITIRSEDRFYNRAGGPIPAYDVFRNGDLIKTIPAGDNPIVTLAGSFDAPGVYRFTFRSKDGKINGKANPILVEENPSRFIYWGETHGHSGFAEGIGSADSYYLFARDDARLDFALHSEHDSWLDAAEWEELRSNAQSFTREGQFYAFLGFEWSQLPAGGGHHNVMFRTPENRKFAGMQTAPLLRDLYAKLKSDNDPKDVLVIPHAHLPGDWRQSDREVEPLVEIVSLHGTFEDFGRAYLREGHQIGFIGGSDDHMAHPGYAPPRPAGLANRSGLAAVRAQEKNSSALFDAMRARSTYATTGERIILDVSINDTPMGGVAPFAPERKISGRVIATAPIQTLAIIKSGKEISSQDYIVGSAEDGEVIGFEFASDSASYKGQHDVPRGWREWKGSITISGARIKSVSADSFRNPFVDKPVIDEHDPTTVHFHTQTRGHSSIFFLELEGAGKDTKIAVSVQEAKESNSVPYVTRKAGQLLPGKNFTLAWDELRDGRKDYAFPVDDFYTDRMTIRRVKSEPIVDQTFEYVDLNNAKPGDYYYVRVQQTDGGTAWSSPVWIGSAADN